MKRKLTSLFVLLLCTCLGAFAQQEYEANSPENMNDSLSTEEHGQLTVKPFTRKDYTHWSLSVEGGLNHPLVDMKPDYKQVFKNIGHHWSVGANAEYTLNPIFALGVGYMYSSTALTDINDLGKFTSGVHHIYPYAAMNFLNYPLFNRNNKWDLWLSVGAGAVHYNSEINYLYNPNLTLYTPQGELINEDIWNDPDRGIGVERTKKWDAVVPIGIELSYNITKQLAISLKYRHFLYANDYLEGGTKLRDFRDDKYQRKNYSYQGSANDQLQNLTLGLRWDIAGKDKTHIRRISWQEFKQKEIGETAPRTVDTLYIEKVVIAPAPPVECTCPEEVVAVYFDFDKTILTKRSLLIISQVAEKMRADESLQLEIRGYTDVVGTDPYNNGLSQRRADKVKDELVNVWGIPASRITANGNGKMPLPGGTNYHHISRRCDFFFTK